MKKIVFFAITAFVSQMFWGNIFGQSSLNGNPMSFYIGNSVTTEYKGLEMKKGWNNDFTLHFPIQTNNWVRISSSRAIAFSTNDRGLSNGLVDLMIQNSGNVGIGTDSPTEKLTVNGNVKLNNGKFIIDDKGELRINSTNELETYGDSLSFNVKGTKGLQMKKGRNNDFTLFFPVSGGGGRLNRIIAADNLSIAAGGRTMNDDNTDLYLHSSGNIGMGTYANASSEKLTVAGNVKLNNGKFIISDKGELRINNTNELEISGDSLSFNVKGTRGLQMKKGRNNDFTLFFPVSEGGGRLNRIIAADNLSIAAGGRTMNDNNTDLYLHSSGNIGMGTYANANSEKLTVAGNIKLNNGKIFVNVDRSQIGEDILEYFSIFAKDGILAEDFAIAPIDEWSDHVFSNEYELRNLKEVENYIKTNNHLPDIPTAAEVKENGYSLHDMNVKLLQKVEELTLYSIEQNKKIEQLEKVVNSYETLLEKVNQLESKINQ